MYVNPFWFGVLMTVVGFVVVMIVIAIVRSSDPHDDTDITPEEYQKFLEHMTGKKCRVYFQDGYLVGEEVEDDDDDDDDAQSD